MNDAQQQLDARLDALMERLRDGGLHVMASKAELLELAKIVKADREERSRHERQSD